MASDARLQVRVTADIRPVISETTFWWLSCEIPRQVREAICEWARFHGLDPDQMPAHEPIIRDVERRQIRCTYFALDEDGHRQIRRNTTLAGDHSLELVIEDHVAQGETPPLPWPDVVLELMEARRADPS